MTRVVVYRSLRSRRSQRWRWKLIVNGRNVANGSEGYSDRAECEEMALRVVSGTYGRELEVENG